MSTRRAIQEKRRKDQRRRTITTIGIVAGAAVVVIAFLIFLNVRPVGSIAEATPREYANAAGTALGDPNAPIVVEEYGDFQCPHCLTWFETVESELVANYVDTGQVYFVFRQFPILGPESTAAANASLCAAEQDSFWPYHDILFANQLGRNSGNYSNRRLVAFAEKVGLDVESFGECLDNNRYQDQVIRDLNDARNLGIQSTPSVVINGQLVPNTSYPFLESQIESLLTAGG